MSRAGFTSTAALLVAALGQGHAAATPIDTTVPQTMQAAAIDRAGGPEVLTLHTLPVPKPAADEVLIAIHTAGVASWDASIREQPSSIVHSAFPLVLGTDGAGVIVALGSHVREFKLGERVYSYSWDNPRGGFYAEYVAVPAKFVASVPQGLSLVQAGAIGTTALTAIQGIDDALHMKTGETLIIHGAAGGVGTLALQFARLRGVRILATATDARGLELVKRLGAEAAVDGRSGDVLGAAHIFAQGGVDAVLGLAGGDSLERCLDALHPGGRLAFPYGVQPEPGPRSGIRTTRYHAIAGPPEFQRLDKAIAESKLEVPIEAEYSLAQAAEAHKRIQAGHVLGKIVLRIRGD